MTIGARIRNDGPMSCDARGDLQALIPSNLATREGFLVSPPESITVCLTVRLAVTILCTVAIQSCPELTYAIEIDSPSVTSVKLASALAVAIASLVR
jgi:hypothetical protein